MNSSLYSNFRLEAMSGVKSQFRFGILFPIRPETQNTPIFGFGWGFGNFGVFAHSTHHYILISDWKQCRVSSPNSDLAFFFLSSTSQSMRAKYTQDWLEQYYFSFTECLRSKFDIKLGTIHILRKQF